ncbi:MAG: Thioesterase [Pseudonocardiales bacterium]|nr:Thioesterase [Pseudonocardiales bacterium]
MPIGIAGISFGDPARAQRSPRADAGQVTYFRRIGPLFEPTEHVTGAWSTDEQHVAPALGLLAHLVEADGHRRRADPLPIARLSYDILGTLPMGPIAVEVNVLRPGRTIELVEATLTHAGRPAVRLRTWLMRGSDTGALAATALRPIPGPDAMPEWDPTETWPGGFIGSVDVRRLTAGPGSSAYWVRTEVPLLDEPVSPLARAAGLLDIANGMAVRADPRDVAFPNVDLTAHLFRPPTPGWLGFDTTVSFGPHGHGVTSSTLHDIDGPIGTLAQMLTVRPR